ncbi:MAG: hypothetical protein OHK006_10360 [Thermodesulfovibrionales bacterium]
MNTRYFRLSLLVLVPVLLCGCASSGLQGFDAGSPKNSIPFFDRPAVEEARVIAVPPMLGDIDGWSEVVAEKLSASRAAIVPLPKLEQALRQHRKELQDAGIEDRPEVLAKLGRAVQADAVVNGIVLSHDNRSELIVQLIASKDGRVLWWQAADFSAESIRPDRSDQDVLVTRMLTPLVLHAGRKTRPVMQGSPQKADPAGRQDRRTKPSRKPETDENISPM